MWPVVAGVVVGAILMGRTKPKAQTKKRELIGPNTGNIYLVDDFPQAGVVIIHGRECVCTFIRKPNGRGFAFVNAMGNPQGVREVCSDLEPSLLQAPPGS